VSSQRGKKRTTWRNARVVGKRNQEQLLINTPASPSGLLVTLMALTLAEAGAADPNAEIDLNVVADPRDPPAKWHSIRPWHPRLALSVTEITSVSATFVVSSLSSSILRHHDDFDPDDDDISTPNTDTLSKGISVNVNGTPWRKCLARLTDDEVEATIIIHGLMPGRHYDIELGIIPGDEKLKGQIVTESESTYPVSVLVFKENSFIDSG